MTVPFTVSFISPISRWALLSSHRWTISFVWHADCSHLKSKSFSF